MWGGIWGSYSRCGAPDPLVLRQAAGCSNICCPSSQQMVTSTSRGAQTMGHELCHLQWGGALALMSHTVPDSCSAPSSENTTLKSSSEGLSSPGMPQSTWARRAGPSYSQNLSFMPVLQTLPEGYWQSSYSEETFVFTDKRGSGWHDTFSPISDFMEPCMSVCLSPPPDGEHLQGRQHVVFTLCLSPTHSGVALATPGGYSINVHCLLHWKNLSPR